MIAIFNTIAWLFLFSIWRKDVWLNIILKISMLILGVWNLLMAISYAQAQHWIPAIILMK